KMSRAVPPLDNGGGLRLMMCGLQTRIVESRKSCKRRAPPRASARPRARQIAQMLAAMIIESHACWPPLRIGRCFAAFQRAALLTVGAPPYVPTRYLASTAHAG